MRPRRLYHLRLVARAHGWPYAPPSLAAEGFIHASYRDAVIESASLYFPPDAPLEVLEIDPDRLASKVVVASTPRGPMPHILGALEPMAVVRTLPFAEFRIYASLARSLTARVSDARRVEDYYLPVAEWCSVRMRRCGHHPWVLGIQGPQGSGKTSLATALVRAFADWVLGATSVSIDDFYLTREQQRALAERHPGDRLMEHRGAPGTHDVALGTKVIDALATLGPGQRTTVPVYDKSMHGGRGDRAPREAWRTVEGPLDLLIVEGWTLGFTAAREDGLEPDLRVPNRALAAYSAWYDRFDAFIQLDVESLGTIVDWRVDAERARRERGKTALSDEDARDYITRFLPVYREYLPRLREHPPGADVLRIVLGPDRLPKDSLSSLGTTTAS